MKDLEVVGIIRDGLGNIVAYELNSGSIIDNEQAAYMVELGELTNVDKLKNPQGDRTITGKDFDITKLPEVK